MDLYTRFLDQIKKEKLLRQGDRLIVALSGGVDSMVLAELCVRAGHRVELAHCNFGLRDAASDNDEAFVREFALSHQLRLHVNRFDTRTYAAANKLSIQVAARQLRYTWFGELIDKAGGAAKARLLTAHHLDDNTETMLMNFFKGTGIAGLRGIRPLQEYIARPLLFASKKELVEYALANNIGWREDESNHENKYTRNFFRNQLLPLVTKVFPEAEQNLRHNQSRFAGVEVLYQEALQKRLKKLQEVHGTEVHVPLRKLLLTPAVETITWELFRPYGFTPAAVPSILALAESETGRFVQSPTHRILRNRNWLVLSPLAEEQQSLVVLDEPGQAHTAIGHLAVTEERFHGQPLDLGSHVALADARNIRFPLLIRPLRKGDYFYPLGMKKKKKIARFLIDIKLSRTQKEKVWVVESDKRIVWVIGYRLDERFRVQSTSGKLLRFTIDQR